MAIVVGWARPTHRTAAAIRRVGSIFICKIVNEPAILLTRTANPYDQRLCKRSDQLLP